MVDGSSFWRHQAPIRSGLDDARSVPSRETSFPPYDRRLRRFALLLEGFRVQPACIARYGAAFRRNGQVGSAGLWPASEGSGRIGTVDDRLAMVAEDLGIEALIDGVCLTRRGAAPVGRRLVLASIARAVTERPDNGLANLRSFYEGSVLTELLPVAAGSLGVQRMYEMLVQMTDSQIESIETKIVGRSGGYTPRRRWRTPPLQAI